MVCIKVITDKDFNIDPISIENPRLRYASRGIIFKDNKIAILNKQLKNEFKLIGGFSYNTITLNGNFFL